MVLLKQSSSERRNAGIDLLRGISIVLVLLNHVGMRIRLAHGVLGLFVPTLVLNALCFNGGEAVMTFFVISGFLIATNSIRRWGSLGAIDARAFYVKRAARIVPCLAVLHTLRVPDYAISVPHQSLSGAAGSAFGLYLNWYEGHRGYLPAGWDVLWSLSIEEVFYLAFPAVCLVLRRDWVLMPAMALLALSGPMAHGAIIGNPIWREKAYLPGMAGIATGVLGALIAAGWKPARKGVLAALVIAGACGMLTILGFEDLLWPWLGEGAIFPLTLGVLCLLLAFHWQAQSARPWRLRGTGWLQSFGRLSYEIYLTHMFVVMTLVRIYKSTGAHVWWGVLWYAPTLFGAWALGWAVARYFSAPAERWMRGRAVQLFTLRK